MEEYPIQTMKIEINNRQSLYKTNQRKIRTLISKIISKASKLSPHRRWKEISIMLVDDDDIMKINQKYFGKNNVTDVISICFNPMPGENQQHTGEIIVNVQCAMNEGTQRKSTNPSRELALYIAHGIDHIHDQNDEDDSERKRMRRRELRWLNEIKNSQTLESARPYSKVALIDDLLSA